MCRATRRTEACNAQAGPLASVPARVFVHQRGHGVQPHAPHQRQHGLRHAGGSQESVQRGVRATIM